MSDQGQTPEPNRPGGRQPLSPHQMKFPRNVFAWLVFIGLAVMLFVFLNQTFERAAEISYTDFRRRVSEGQVVKCTIEPMKITAELRENVTGLPPGASRKVEVKVPEGLVDDPAFIDKLNADVEKAGGTVEFKYSNNLFLNILLPMIPWILIFGFIWFFLFRQLRSSAGAGGILGNFGRSKHRITTKEHTNITFEDVAGIDEAKDEVQEIIAFLRNPKKFQRLGGRIPRGVLLIGEPGTGKTLLAKAIAGEADVPFFSICGSDFVEMFVGVGASRVRDLFKQAKENSPCIIFLDEIDAVGRRRGAGFNGGGHDEREQTLNAILVEMDGFDTNDQVIVIAATNRSDVLDPALVRPGRFDRQIYIPLPDIKGRYDILKVHVKKIRPAPNCDLHRLARGTPMFSGADLAAIINEAALAATMADKDFVEQEDLEEARDKVRWGRAKKSRVMDDVEKRIVAFHESGHAVVAHLLPDADPLHKVSILPRAQAGGMTAMLPEKDRHLLTRRYGLAQLKVSFGGRVAEEIFCDDISSGAAADIRQATALARQMICDWGMSDKLGPIRYSTDDGRTPFIGFGDLTPPREHSDKTAELIDQEVKALVDQAYRETQDLIRENRDFIERVAAALLKYETLDADDVERILRGETLTKPTVSDLLAAEQARLAKPPPSEEKRPGLSGLSPDLGEPGPVPTPT